MGDDFDKIMSTEKFIEPTAKLGVPVLCLVRRTRLRQVVHPQLMPGQMLLALKLACEGLKIRLVVGHRPLTPTVAEPIIEPTRWKLTETLWRQCLINDNFLCAGYFSS